MQLIGQTVCHTAFGTGVVTDQNDSVLTVSFHGQPKKFLYPDAFEKFLTLRSDALQDKVDHVLQQETEARESRLHAMEEVIARKSRLTNMHIAPKSQAAFDVSRGPSPFDSWSVSVGTYLSGAARGEVRIPDRLKPNSMCLLTSLPAGRPERERRIIGAFMVQEDFFGSCCPDGIIHAHPNFRLQLPEDRQPLFWDYFPDTAHPSWGRVALKYFSNQTGEKMLQDIICRAETPEEADAAHPFYDYYCRINRLAARSFGSDNT